MRLREPVRTCVGCREEGTKSSLLRLVRDPDGNVQPDPAGLAPGRGAYLHLRTVCIDRARRRRALERALKGQVPEGVWTELKAEAADISSGGRSASHPNSDPLPTLPQKGEGHCV